MKKSAEVQVGELQRAAANGIADEAPRRRRRSRAAGASRTAAVSAPRGNDVLLEEQLDAVGERLQHSRASRPTRIGPSRLWMWPRPCARAHDRRAWRDRDEAEQRCRCDGECRRRARRPPHAGRAPSPANEPTRKRSGSRPVSASAVHLPEHDVEAADDRDDVGDHAGPAAASSSTRDGREGRAARTCSRYGLTCRRRRRRSSRARRAGSRCRHVGLALGGLTPLAAPSRGRPSSPARRARSQRLADDRRALAHLAHAHPVAVPAVAERARARPCRRGTSNSSSVVDRSTATSRRRSQSTPRAAQRWGR